MKIHHVAIICSDYQKSKNFYVNVLGFAVIVETYRAARDSYKLDLRVDEHFQIELFTFQGAPARPSYPEACGLRHLAFAVPNVEKMVAELEAAGVVVEQIRIDETTGKKCTFFADPDGLPLELYED